MERWEPISEFPYYLVSDAGFVRHESKKKDLIVSVNNTGNVFVSLWVDGKAVNRSLARLVAQTFLDIPIQPSFDTPINLNGDRYDNRALNLVWRPLWFARRYFQQFNRPPEGFSVPIIELKTGEQFSSSWEAAIKYGLLDRQIFLATMGNRPVWPTDQLFEPIWRNTPYRTA